MAEARIPVRMNRLCCPICSQVLGNPVTVPCGHNFCMRCIQERWDREERSRSPCSCPECGDRFPSRPLLIENTTLADLVRDTPALKRARTWSKTGSPLCGRHSISLDVYCCTDEKVICQECASAEHTGHTFGFVSRERRRNQEELKNIQMKSQQILQKQEKKQKNLKKALELIQEEARNTEDHCEAVLAGVIDAIQRHFLSLKKVIGAQEEAMAARVQTSLQTLEVRMNEMRERSAELERLAQTDDNVHFLERWPSLRRLHEEDHPHPLGGASEDPLRPFELTKRAVDELGRQLEVFCDTEFATISRTADSGESGGETGRETEDGMQQRCEASTSQSHRVNITVTEQTVEPKTRADFLQYACGLSLDPTTAHQDLAIRAGDKEVRNDKSSTMFHPERFLHRRQVLCREGLQAERCYYEVEVKGDKAEIALTYRGMDRKSRSSLSAFGGNAYSWSLDRSRNYSVSHRGESVQLTTPPSQHRIGIYLEFKKGALSFYEVSDSMKFLYKVEAKFTEALYPGFWLGEKCCIRICDLRHDRL
ncbi:tripartite motif-containing protein 16-like [Acanthopagrus schlegelii]